MENEVQRSRPASKRKTVIFIILAAFIILTLSVTTAFAHMLLQNDKVYKGVYIGGQDISGMGRQELKQVLDNKYKAAFDNLDITLKAGKSELTASYPELDVRYDIEAAVQNAYAVGRGGSIVERLFDIAQAGVNGVTLNMPMSFDEKKLESFVGRFYDMTFVNVEQNALLITDSNVTIRSGRNGEIIDKSKTLELVKASIADRKAAAVEPEIIVTPRMKFNVDDLHQQIVREPFDAFYRLENSALTLIPHIVGRHIDKSRLAEILSELDKSESVEHILPVIYTEPSITSDLATALLFKDELASAGTRFSTETQNGKNRKYNMGLAVEKFNNMILVPGQEFSFNEIIGPRSVETGFKIAQIYSAGKIVDGVGGGICQVSSTMYTAVLKADLQVNERQNHSFTVSYVPLGQDATAFYGGTDFRFVNSSKWPIKLTASVSGNRISFSITGTKDTPGKTVVISSKILKETPFPVKYTDDPTLSVGMTKETQEGLKGYVVETYKTIKIDGKTISQAKLHTSKYKAYARELLQGTKPLEASGDTKTTTSGALVPPPETIAPSNPAAPMETVNPTETPIPN